MEKKNQPDLVLFLITLVLLIIGLIMVLSASSYEAMLDYDDALYFFKRQAAFMALGFIPMFIMMNINIDFVKKLLQLEKHCDIIHRRSCGCGLSPHRD